MNAHQLRTRRDLWRNAGVEEFDNLVIDNPTIAGPLGEAFALGMLEGGDSLDAVRDAADHGYGNLEVPEAMRRVADDMFSNAADDGALDDDDDAIITAVDTLLGPPDGEYFTGNMEALAMLMGNLCREWDNPNVPTTLDHDVVKIIVDHAGLMQ